MFVDIEKKGEIIDFILSKMNTISQLDDTQEVIANEEYRKVIELVSKIDLRDIKFMNSGFKLTEMNLKDIKLIVATTWNLIRGLQADSAIEFTSEEDRISNTFYYLFEDYLNEYVPHNGKFIKSYGFNHQESCYLYRAGDAYPKIQGNSYKDKYELMDTIIKKSCVHMSDGSAGQLVSYSKALGVSLFKYMDLNNKTPLIDRTTKKVLLNTIIDKYGKSNFSSVIIGDSKEYNKVDCILDFSCSNYTSPKLRVFFDRVIASNKLKPRVAPYIDAEVLSTKSLIEEPITMSKEEVVGLFLTYTARYLDRNIEDLIKNSIINLEKVTSTRYAHMLKSEEHKYFKVMEKIISADFDKVKENLINMIQEANITSDKIEILMLHVDFIKERNLNIMNSGIYIGESAEVLLLKLQMMEIGGNKDV